MALPSVALPRKTLTIGDETIEVRALSRSEAIRISQFRDDPDEGETFIVAAGCGVSMDEAREWRNNSPMEAVGTVVDAIAALSGLTPGEDGETPFK